MTEQTYLRYAEIKNQIKVLEGEFKALQDDIIQDIVANDGATVDMSLGSFFITKSKKWTYTSAVDELDKCIKDLKMCEQDTNLATCEETTGLSFRAQKLSPSQEE